MGHRSSRNRKRSQRRNIFCPIHDLYLDSVSPKFKLYADRPEHLQQRGMGRRTSLLLVAQHTAVPLPDEWLEAFWCKGCGETKWYHIRKTGDRTFTATVAPVELWQQVERVMHPHGNPTVGEFSYRHARRPHARNLQDFHKWN